MTTLREATESGVDYWQFFVLVEGKQILAPGRKVRHVYYSASTDLMTIGRLSAPASLEAVAEGNGFCRFELGDGRLTVWPTKEECHDRE